MAIDTTEGRGYDGVASGRPEPWKCPRCGADNVSVLGSVCVGCGSGGGARKLTPEEIEAQNAEIRRKARATPEFDPPLVGPKVAGPREPGDHDAILHLSAEFAAVSEDEQLFREYCKRYGHDRTRTDLRQAFMAGLAVGKTLGQNPLLTIDTKTGEVKQIAELPALPGTPKARTLAMALERFITEVLDFDPEEVKTGEWLSANDARALLTQLQETK